MGQRLFTRTMICLALLAVSAIADASEASKPWMEQVQTTLGPPVVVAQTDETGLKWGVWQFPTISRPEPALLLVAFYMNEDRHDLDPSKFQPPGKYQSRDGGKTWEKSNLEHGVTSHCGPTRICQARNGDLLNVVRSRLMLKPAAGGAWQEIPIAVDDPESGKSKFYGIGQIVELPDGSLLGVKMTTRPPADRKQPKYYATYCVRSTDRGRTWKFQGIVASYDENQPLNGYCEASVDVLPDGSLLAALRTEGGMEVNQRTGILYLAQSYDNGLTWSRPRAVNPFGVFPQVLTLKNGVTVLSFGRPGVNILYNVDGRGERWQGLTLLVNEGQRFTHTSGYTSLLPTGPDRFIIAYDQFDYPNDKGEPRKTILVREIVVSR